LSLPCVAQKRQNPPRETLFGKSSLTIWIADAHRDDGKRYIVRADEKLTAFVELEGAICGCRWPKNKSPFGLNLMHTA